MKENTVTKYEKEGNTLLVQAKQLVITDEHSRSSAAEFTMRARQVVKTIEDEFRPDVAAANDLHKRLLARMKKLQSPFLQAQKIVDEEIRRDYLLQEEMRREQERARREAEAAARRAEEEARNAEIEKQVDSGEFDKARELAEEQLPEIVTAPVPAAEKTIRTEAGSTTVRKDILVELTDKELAVDSVAAGILPLTVVDFRLSLVKAFVRSTGTMEIPGFTIKETAVISGRRW